MKKLIAFVFLLFLPLIVDAQAATTSVVFSVGDPCTLTCKVDGTSPAFQWQKDGVDIPGATASVYRIAAIKATDVGSYVCKCSNSLGAVLSNTATAVLVIPLSNAVTTIEKK